MITTTARDVYKRQIPVRNRIHGILRYGVKAQFRGKSVAVQADGGTGDGSGTQRGNVQAPAAVREAVCVPVQHFHVSQQMVAHQMCIRDSVEG